MAIKDRVPYSKKDDKFILWGCFMFTTTLVKGPSKEFCAPREILNGKQIQILNSSSGRMVVEYLMKLNGGKNVKFCGKRDGKFIISQLKLYSQWGIN